jgi:hypothetical protein
MACHEWHHKKTFDEWLAKEMPSAFGEAERTKNTSPLRLINLRACCMPASARGNPAPLAQHWLGNSCLLQCTTVWCWCRVWLLPAQQLAREASRERCHSPAVPPVMKGREGCWKPAGSFSTFARTGSFLPRGGLNRESWILLYLEMLHNHFALFLFALCKRRTDLF